MKFLLSISIILFFFCPVLAQQTKDTITVIRSYKTSESLKCIIQKPIELAIFQYIVNKNEVRQILNANDTTMSAIPYRIIDNANILKKTKADRLGKISLCSSNCDGLFISYYPHYRYYYDVHFQKTVESYFSFIEIINYIPINLNTGKFRDIVFSHFSSEKSKIRVEFYANCINGNSPRRQFHFKAEFLQISEKHLIVSFFSCDEFN